MIDLSFLFSSRVLWWYQSMMAPSQQWSHWCPPSVMEIHHHLFQVCSHLSISKESSSLSAIKLIVDNYLLWESTSHPNNVEGFSDINLKCTLWLKHHQIYLLDHLHLETIHAQVVGFTSSSKVLKNLKDICIA